MTILQLVTRRQYRGAEVFAAQLSEKLAENGHDILFAGLYKPPGEMALTVVKGESLDLSALSARAVPHWSILRAIADTVKNRAVAIVQANASDNLKYAVLSKLIFGWEAPIVYRNASILSAWLKNGLHRRLIAAMLGRVDAIACVSKRSYEDLSGSLVDDDDKLHYLPIGTDIPAEVNRTAGERVFAEHGIPRASWKLLHVGAFGPEKNQAFLVRLLSELPKNIRDRTIDLVLIGEGPLKDRVERAADDLGVRGSVHFLGYRTDVVEIMRAADVLLLPSLIEGTPGVLIEAGANYLPSLAHDVGSVWECFPESSRSATLVPVGDVNVWVDRIYGLLEDDKERSSLAEMNRTYVAHTYALEKVAEGFEQLYRSLLSK